MAACTSGGSDVDEVTIRLEPRALHGHSRNRNIEEALKTVLHLFGKQIANSSLGSVREARIVPAGKISALAAPAFIGARLEVETDRA